MGAIVDPFAGCGDPLAGGDDRGMADDGHKVAMTARKTLWNVTRSTRPASTSSVDDSGAGLM
jgi:hypothetical protein